MAEKSGHSITSLDNNSDAIKTSTIENYDKGNINSDMYKEKQHDSHSERNDGAKSVNTSNVAGDTNNTVRTHFDSPQTANAGSTLDVNTTDGQESLFDDDKESVLSVMDEFVPVNPSKDGKRVIAFFQFN